ncbi:membrane protein FAM174A-like isoform X2 [Portunus trituberculatus]|uniref:membrane protein FAM174A-like isoform X2 n=1 Tax=Portunus trituberculatus TaxID=210409 RepID=UPI001E1CC90B|nr:membrane protein FAM174A-like isoform X2 [Portunus trituberculatus]
MDHRAIECRHKKSIEMFPATQVLGSGRGGGGRKRTEVLSGMIVWNVLVLVLLVLAVCVQGVVSPSDTSSHLVLRRSPQAESVKEDGVAIPQLEKSADQPTLVPQSDPGGDSGPPQVSKATPKPIKKPKGGKEETQEGKEGSGNKPPAPENKDTSNTTKGDGEAVLRGFYVFVGICVIVLIYIVIKLIRLRRRRAPGKYRVLSHTDDQEMFPLAAGEGEDEEIFNAAHHQPRK